MGRAGKNQAHMAAKDATAVTPKTTSNAGKSLQDRSNAVTEQRFKSDQTAKMLDLSPANQVFSRRIGKTNGPWEK
jgi:hypothetical protein